MRPAEACDFFFAGAAILPGFLAYAEMPALGVMAFVALLVAGAVSGIGDPNAPHHLAKPPARRSRRPRTQRR